VLTCMPRDWWQQWFLSDHGKLLLLLRSNLLAECQEARNGRLHQAILTARQLNIDGRAHRRLCCSQELRLSLQWPWLAAQHSRPACAKTLVLMHHFAHPLLVDPNGQQATYLASSWLKLHAWLKLCSPTLNCIMHNWKAQHYCNKRGDWFLLLTYGCHDSVRRFLLSSSNKQKLLQINLFKVAVITNSHQKIHMCTCHSITV